MRNKGSKYKPNLLPYVYVFVVSMLMIMIGLYMREDEKKVDCAYKAYVKSPYPVIVIEPSSEFPKE